MKSRAEVRIVAASFALLVGLVVPVSAAVIDATAVPAASAETAAAGHPFFVAGAPQPLVLMALGALVVLIPITRRARRVGEPASAGSLAKPGRSS